ncbi:MAG: DNA-3-methyladenine glycosylase [Chloroflexia bacterium]|nr:DNA-3-methyladenine glycosylase [Chloroflexia bacterium]
MARPSRDWLTRPTAEAARLLLGCLVVTDLPAGRCVGRIVETEAYLGPADPASHAFKRTTGRVAVMAGEAGIAYVYRSYGLHAMLNVVAKPAGETGAVLVRALEPVAGIDLMRARRGREDIRDLCSGPGKLCQAIGITLNDHGLDLLTDGRVWLGLGPPVATVSHGPRIGITRAVDWPLRFWETGSPFVSAGRAGTPFAAPGLVLPLAAPVNE